MFRINSHTLTSQASSEKVSYIIQRKIKDKAITAGIVGGILFFIVAIILAVCTVKCVNKRNKRRRREQENGITFQIRFIQWYFEYSNSKHFALLTSEHKCISLIHYFCMIQHQLVAYSMVACQMSADTRNGCQSGPAKSVPSRK